MPPPFQGTRTEEELTASWTGWDRKGWWQGPRSSFGDELLLSQARERLATAPGIQCSRSWVAFERRNKKIKRLTTVSGPYRAGSRSSDSPGCSSVRRTTRERRAYATSDCEDNRDRCRHRPRGGERGPC